MRVAGVFAEVVLGFVAVGLALTAFGVAPSAEQTGQTGTSAISDQSTPTGDPATKSTEGLQFHHGQLSQNDAVCIPQFADKLNG